MESDFALYSLRRRQVHQHLNITNVTVIVQMYLSKSQSLKIKKNYNSLASHSVSYWFLYLTDCAMENVPLNSKHSDRMKVASSDECVKISMSNNLRGLNFLHCHSKKMISKCTNVRDNSRSFYWIHRYKWNGDYTHQSICSFRFHAEVAKHCPHYVEPAFIVSRQLV
jgi:hypothetical protein